MVRRPSTSSGQAGPHRQSTWLFESQLKKLKCISKKYSIIKNINKGYIARSSNGKTPFDKLMAGWPASAEHLVVRIPTEKEKVKKEKCSIIIGFLNLYIARSSNGKTRPFGGCYVGSNPTRAAIPYDNLRRMR